MAMYEPLRDAFNEMNRMFIDRQEWQAKHERRAENDAWNRQVQEDKMKRQAMQDEITARKLVEVKYQTEPIGVKETDLVDGSNDDVNQWWAGNRELTAKQFANDPQAMWGPNPQTGESSLLVPDRRREIKNEDGEMVVNPQFGAMVPFMTNRQRMAPKLQGYMFSMISDVDPIAGQYKIFTELTEDRENTIKEYKAKGIQPGDPRFTSQNAEYQTKLSAIDNDLRQMEPSRMFHLDEQGQPRIRPDGTPMFKKQWMREQLDSKEDMVNDLMTKMTMSGADPAMLNRAYEQAMTGIAADRARMEGNKNMAVAEKLYLSYRQEGGEKAFHRWYNENFQQPKSSTDYQTYVAQRHAEVEMQRREEEAMGIPAKDRTKRPSAKALRHEYVNLKEDNNTRDLTPNVAIRAIEDLFYQLPQNVRTDLQTAGPNGTPITFADAAKAVKSRSKAKGISREDALFEVYGEIRSGDFSSVNRAAKGQPDKFHKKPAPAKKRTGPVSKKATFKQITSVRKQLNNSPEAAAQPVGTGVTIPGTSVKLIKMPDGSWKTEAEAKKIKAAMARKKARQAQRGADTETGRGFNDFRRMTDTVGE